MMSMKNVSVVFFKTPAWEDSRMEEEAMIRETKTLVDDIRPIPKAERKGGGFTCCVPHCFNNSKRYTNLLSIKNWRPRQGKARIEGKMATYDFKKKFTNTGIGYACINNVPTIAPKNIGRKEPQGMQTTRVLHKNTGQVDAMPKRKPNYIRYCCAS